MAVELKNEETLGKFSGGLIKMKGVGKKLVGAMAVIMSINAFAVPAVQAAEMPIQNDFDVQQLKDYKADFNLTYTKENQEKLINAGYFIGDVLGKDVSTLEKTVNVFNNYHTDFLNENSISQRDLGEIKFAEEIIKQNDIQSAPNYLISQIDSPYPDLSELSAEAKNTIAAKAESMTKNLDEKPYNSLTEAYDFMQESYNTKIRYNGGADVYDSQGQWQDISMERADIMKGFVDFASKGVTEEMKYELPNYLASYDNEQPSYEMDKQSNNMLKDLKVESSNYASYNKSATDSFNNYKANMSSPKK